MIDIDDFKSYNDTYGHIEGDECLKLVAQTMMSVRRRETDIIGRYGGEEFAVILPETDSKGGLLIANEILNRIRKLNIEHTHSSAESIVTVSIGLATFIAENDSPQEINFEDFIHQADLQMYKAKASGKNCISHVSLKTEVAKST